LLKRPGDVDDVPNEELPLIESEKSSLLGDQEQKRYFQKALQVT
jgi:hypothetical protein